jgi:tetratricopeptide (TPR) repeat protein
MPADAVLCPSCGGPAKKNTTAPGAQPFFGVQGTSTCPVCNTHVGAGDIVCVNCGANLLTGQKPVKEQVREKRDMRGAVNALKYAGIILLIVCCSIVLFVVAQQLLRDPVGNARVAAKSGNLEEASASLQKYLQSAPEDLEAQFLLGQVYWQGQQYDRAWEAFESVARQGGPRDRDAALLALLAMERISESPNRQRQLTLLSSLVQQRYPQDSELLKVVALLQGVEGEYRGQLETTETLKRMNAEPAVLPGLAYAMSEDAVESEKELLAAMNANPENKTVAAALGFVHQMRGQEELALAVLQQAQDADTEVAALVKLQLGSLLMRRDEYGKALPLLTEAKAGLPGDPQCEFLHAVCLQQNKLLDEALVAYEKMASATGEFSGLAALQMAVIYLDRGNYDQAASFVRRAGEAGITSARQSTVQGRVYAMQGDMNQAEQAYRRALSIAGDYPAARLELGLLLVNRGAIDEGLAELEQYLELASLNPVLYRANEIDVLVAQIKQAKQ